METLSESAINIVTDSESNFIVTEEHRKNLIYAIFDGYYQHINKPIIFDTSRIWTKKTNFLKKLFPYTKILCPVRDIISILNSLLPGVFFTKEKIVSAIFSLSKFG